MKFPSKAQLFRAFRLVTLVFVSTLLPVVLHWHGPVSFALVSAAVVAAGEVTFRHFVPNDAALLGLVERLFPQPSGHEVIAHAVAVAATVDLAGAPAPVSPTTLTQEVTK